jgi:hypothetical protein
MIEQFKRWWARRSHQRKHGVYVRRRQALPSNSSDVLSTGRLALLREFIAEITFARYNAAQAEQIRYRGLYARADALTEAVGLAYSCIFQNREAAIADAPVDNHREPTLDYFLTTRDNHAVSPGVVFTQLCQWLFEIDDLMAALETEDPSRYQYYTLRYTPLFSDALNALDVLVTVSDLSMTPR